MEIYLIRHGESESNFDGTHSGHSPVNLTEKGRKQALGAKKLIEGVKFDKIFASDVKRAQQTAKIIFPEAKFVYTPLLREIDNTAMRGKTFDDMYAEYGEKYASCRRNFDYAPLGLDCESGEHLRLRAGEFLYFAQKQAFKTAAAVCHAGIIRAIAAYILKTPTHNPPMACDNASVSKVYLKNGTWRIGEWNRHIDLSENEER